MAYHPVKSLIGITEELDRAVQDLAFFGIRYQEFHPGATGDVSQVLSEETRKVLVERFSETRTEWFKLATLEYLASIRNDGRTGYRSEGIKNPEFYQLIKPMAGKAFLITCTGSQIPAICQSLEQGEDGRWLNLVEVDEQGEAIRILYGNREFGTIPSIETHIHILANAVSISEGVSAPAMVHAHPCCLIRLGADKKIEGDFKKFNAAIYTRIEGLNRIDTGLVGVVPYVASGSAELVDASIEFLRRHQLILWMTHGFVVRSFRIERGYAIMDYAEQCAKAALDSLRYNTVGLPLEFIEEFLRSNDLFDAYQNLGLRSP